MKQQRVSIQIKKFMRLPPYLPAHDVKATDSESELSIVHIQGY